MPSIADLTVRRPKLALLLIGVMSAIAIWGMTKDLAHRPIGSPIAKAEREFSDGVFRDFGSDGSEVLLLVDVQGRGDLFDREPARAFGEILEIVRAQPAVASALSLDQIPAFGFGIGRLDLFPEPDAGELKRSACRRRALEHPVVAGNLLSEDARSTLVPLVLKVENRKQATKAVEQIGAAVRDAAAGSPLRARLLGTIPISIARDQAFKEEKIRFTVIGFSLAAGLALLVFRGILTTLIVVAPPAIGVLWTFGALGFTGSKLNGMSEAIMPTIIIMVGFTNAAHLVFQIRRERLSGLAPHPAAATALKKVGLPCLLSALTTAAGFGSLAVAEAQLLRDFGRDCAVGTLLTFAAVILVAPLLALTPLGAQLDKRGAARKTVAGGEGGPFRILIDAVLDRSRSVVGATLILTLGCIWLTTTLQPDMFLEHQLPDNSDATAALAHADAELGGVQIVRVAIGWKADSGDPLAVLEQVETIIDNEPLLSNPMSIRTVLEVLPGFGSDLSRRIHLLNNVPPEIVRSLFQPDINRAVVATRVQDLGVARYAPVYDRLEERFAELAAQNPGFDFGLAGIPVGWGRYAHRMVNDLVRSLGVAAAIILAMITIAFRSPRIGMVAVLPNLFPLLACAAAIALLKLPLTLAFVCAFTICLGIAADDSIHFLSRYRTERAAGLTVDDALRTSFIRVGQVLVVTTAVMLGGLGSILFSSLPMFRSFATVACATLAAALVADLIILPALIKLTERR
jgi:predicted RND superfamily exporter protein